MFDFFDFIKTMAGRSPEDIEDQDNTAFQQLLNDIGYLAIETASRNYHIPRPDSPCFGEALNETVMQYLGIMLQTVPKYRKTIYGYVNEYYPHTLEESLRKFYRHEERIRERAGRGDPNGRRLYDPADFLAIQNRVYGESPLVETILRKNIHVAKNVSSAQFAELYAEYDREYREAADLKDDSDYVFASINFYRMEHALAISLIANIADYMSTHHLKQFDFEKAAPFITDAAVPDVESPKERSFCAWPNLLSVSANIPNLFSEDPLSSPLIDDFGSRVLKQNILERLPHPNQYKEEFDLSEVATFIRRNVQIIESHTPVSFYLDEDNDILDKSKIKIARMLMRQLYSFPSKEPIKQQS